MPPELPTTMHAWRKHKGNPTPVLDTVSVPACPPTGFLVRLLAAGVCHSDQALLEVEDRPGFQDIYVLGHEGCGEVVQIGRQVTDTRFKIGSRVAMLAVPGCGETECPECGRDLAQLCSRAPRHGIGQDGFYAQYCAIDQRAAILVPENVDSAVAAVATDAVTTAYHGIVRRAELKMGEIAFLFGLGGLGFNALQIARSIGARIIVSDVRQGRLDAAKELGLDEADIVPLEMTVQEFVKERGLEGRIDTVLEFVGMHQTFEDAQQIVRPGGKILCVGTLDRDNTLHMKIGIRKRLSIIFTYGGQYRDIVDVLDCISQGVLNPQVEIGEFEKYDEIMKQLCAGKIESRMAILPNGRP